jgi:hypothetical protein
MSVPKFQPNDLVRHIGSSEILTVKIWYEAVNKYSVWKGDDAGTQTILAEDELELVARASSGFDDEGPRLIPTQSIMN